MKTIKIWNDNPSGKQLDEICAALEDGGVVLMPTDTLYALTCDALNPKAIDRLCCIKGMDPDKTDLSIICRDISMASEYARIEDEGFSIMRDYMPGPFTILCKAAKTLPKAFKGRKTVGIRIPDAQLCRLVADRLGHPLLTTSIRYEDEDHAVSPGLIAESYEGQADLMVEGEEGGTVPSTIIDCTGPDCEIVRQGKGKLL